MTCKKTQISNALNYVAHFQPCDLPFIQPQQTASFFFFFYSSHSAPSLFVFLSSSNSKPSVDRYAAFRSVLHTQARLNLAKSHCYTQLLFRDEIIASIRASLDVGWCGEHSRRARTLQNICSHGINVSSLASHNQTRDSLLMKGFCIARASYSPSHHCSFLSLRHTLTCFETRCQNNRYCTKPKHGIIEVCTCTLPKELPFLLCSSTLRLDSPPMGIQHSRI